MAPNKGSTLKSMAEQESWDWVHTAEQPLTLGSIREEHIFQSYGINAAKCDRGSCRINCKRNPSCHNNLGEKFWYSEMKDSFWVELEDPENERKPEGSHAGLKNLGATCYVNTFLQLWFHNPYFRSAIFKWTPSGGYQWSKDEGENEVEKSEELSGSTESKLIIPILKSLPSPTFGSSPADDICGNLQLLFALMKYSEKKFVDPTPFVQSLGLQTDEQQDAQEFSKLFMSLLESSLSNQHDSVKDLVQDQYGGQYAYETRCNVCGKVSKTESNFYELDLSIQGHVLLRECIKEFLKEEKLDGDNRYFCANCQSKQDATRKIVLQSLPPVLNLQLLRFVFDRNTGSKRKCNTTIRFTEHLDMNEFIELDDPSQGIYELSAVLIHCGLSAFSGHYVAHILDKKDEAWYRFNDETVEKMKGRKLQLGTEDDPEDDGKTPKKVKSLKGQHGSKNAYMLVYTRKGTDDSNEIRPPGFIQEYVATSNSLFDNWVTKMKKLMDSQVNEGRLRRQETLEIYDNLQPHSIEDSEWVATEWLRKWLNEKQTLIGPVDNSSLICKHGRFDPCKVKLSKRISTSSADKLFAKYNGFPRLKADSFCVNCVYNRARQIQFDTRLHADKKIISAAIKANYNGNDGFWVGKSSLKHWKQFAVDVQNFDVTSEMNDNNGMVKSCDDDIAPPHCSPVKLKNNIKEADDDDNNDNDDKEMKIMKLDNGKKRILENESNVMAGNTFNFDVQCESHGNLCIDVNKRKLISKEAWDCLKFYFKNCPEFHATVEPCSLCKEQSAKKQERKQLSRVLANEMKNSLSDLYQNTSRPFLIREASFEVYAVSRSTIDDWRKFLRFVSSHQFDFIENSDLFCEHGKLIYNANDFFDPGTEESYVLLTKEEWNLLSNYAAFDREIKLTNTQMNSEDNDLCFSISQECCDECRAVRCVAEKELNSQFYNANIYIRKVNDDDKTDAKEQETFDFKEDGDSHGYEQIEKKQEGKKRKLFEPLEGTRKSARHRIQRGEYALKVNSTQTLKDLKVQLISIFSVIPCDQHLSLMDGTPLVEDSLSLADLSIHPGSILLLRVDKPNEKIHIEPVNANGERKVEEGFKGTGLCGVFQSDRCTDS